MSTYEWRALVRKLRKHFPLSLEIIARRRRMKRACGVTTFNGYNFRIYIDSGMCREGQVDALIHEWAHARAIDQAYSHCDAWGMNYVELYDFLSPPLTDVKELRKRLRKKEN